MKKIEDMSYEELKEEIKYIVSLIDDSAKCNVILLAVLTEAYANRTIER